MMMTLKPFIEVILPSTYVHFGRYAECRAD
ncbi:hypothetical protein SAMN02787142_2516 [Burkholderia sp. WP9]|nr:hypothetical protein SAMN02787142_2516 [Burkholderia sp. WP9]